MLRCLFRFLGVFLAWPQQWRTLAGLVRCAPFLRQASRRRRQTPPVCLMPAETCLKPRRNADRCLLKLGVSLRPQLAEAHPQCNEGRSVALINPPAGMAWPRHRPGGCSHCCCMASMNSPNPASWSADQRSSQPLQHISMYHDEPLTDWAKMATTDPPAPLTHPHTHSHAHTHSLA